MKKQSTSGESLDKVLAAVEVGPDSTRDVWIEFGRLKENYANSALLNFLFVEKLARVKTQKLYKGWGVNTWEEFISTTFPFSVDTADRIVADLRELGKGYFDLNEIVRVSRQAFRSLNPDFTDKNEIVLGGEKYALTRQNSDAIQMVIKQLEAEKRRKAEEASVLKGDLDKARTERDNAKKAASEATRKLREAQNPAPFADADEDHQVILRVQSEVDKAMVLLAKLRGREMSAENQRRFVGLCHKLHHEFLRAVDDAQVTFDSALDPSDPEMALALNNEPDFSIDNVREFVGRKKDGK